jgi:N-hydroxyarylamine O-acetyltransferase
LELAAYLHRIGFTSEARPDLATLKALHRAHLYAIPFETLDVQLGRPLTTDPAAAFDKLVTRRRGGWCYEMNGLFGWALGEIGFEVTRMCGGVWRVARGDEAMGNHLILRVDLAEGAWLADVGFGDGPVEPYAIAPAAFAQGGFDYRLETDHEGWWRLHNHAEGSAPSFDFRLETASEGRLSELCGWLQASADSPFVQNAVCQRHRPGAVLQFRGRVLRTVTAAGVEESLVESADEYAALLREAFDLDMPETASLWPAIVARHEALFPST